MNIISKKIIKCILYIPFVIIWYLERFIPRDKNLWIFGSSDGIGYEDNARSFFEYMLLNHPEITIVWLTRNNFVYNMLRSKKIPVFMLYSIKGVFLSLRAKYYVTDHGISDLNVYTCNGAKKINLWHGMPIKKMGYGEDCYEKGLFFTLKYMLFNILFPFNYRREDMHLLIVTSDFFKHFLSLSFATIRDKKFPMHKIITTGLPRNDKLFTHAEQPFLNACREKYRGCRIVFYMPTFRINTYLRNNTPFSAFCGFEFNHQVFTQFLEEENIVFLFKPHPYDTNLPDFSITDRFLYLKGTEYNDLYAFLGNIDILATDYSSVYFDFLLTKKPVILMPFDYDDYVKMRGLFYDYNVHIFGSKAYNWNDFIRIIKQKEYYTIDDSNLSLYHYYKDDKSCERVFKTIIEKI